MLNQVFIWEQVWKNLEDDAMEYCLIRQTSLQVEIQSHIIGVCDPKAFEVYYEIFTNQLWEVTGFRITSFAIGKWLHWQGHRISPSTLRVCVYSGNEEVEGHGIIDTTHLHADQEITCNEVSDIDIPLTPLTNTLPIRRLKMQPGEEEMIRVLYCDVPGQELRVVSQKYTCLAKNKYHYENVPNDFEATITVNEHGFVMEYPGLFQCISSGRLKKG